MFKNLLITILVGISFVAVSVQYLHGEEYPAKPIEIFVPYGAGGSLDLGARIIAQVAKNYLGQPLIVINRMGAGGTVAASEVLRFKPDGYKLLYYASTYFATTIKSQNLPYDPSYFVPLINFAEERSGLVVKGNSPWNTLGQLLDYGRQNPGKVKWNHTGRGIAPHINQLLIFRRAGVETIDVPYKSSPDQLAAVLGGHADASSTIYVAAKDNIKAGNLRLLVTHSNRRYADTSNVPCATELGFPNPILMYHGFYIHKDTPKDIKDILFNAFKKTFEYPEFKKLAENIGMEPLFGGPEFMSESIKKAEEVGVPILKELGLYDKSWDSK
ncbi:MAG: hypothetical protein A2169_00435 [Deltaproteobacteria bacterium RBG_13_47_9]|nr:MAG: hypothetical protein A2169_00435 [Deltaproteobacteria bacterium RBG_13_47_9]